MLNSNGPISCTQSGQPYRHHNYKGEGRQLRDSWRGNLDSNLHLTEHIKKSLARAFVCECLVWGASCPWTRSTGLTYITARHLLHSHIEHWERWIPLYSFPTQLPWSIPSGLFVNAKDCPFPYIAPLFAFKTKLFSNIALKIILFEIFYIISLIILILLNYYLNKKTFSHFVIYKKGKYRPYLLFR